jgi:hypothetical protein
MAGKVERARAASGRLQRRHELLGYAERRLAGLDANLALCARAAPAGAMAVIE